MLEGSLTRLFLLILCAQAILSIPTHTLRTLLSPVSNIAMRPSYETRRVLTML
jgi:hypothetical protein